MTELRDRVIEAATKSFAMFGYKGTTMDQVAKIAGVAKGSIYMFFDSKESLFTHILNNMIQEVKTVADRAVAEHGPFFDALERALHGILDYRRKHELFVKLVQEVREIGTSAVKEGLAYVEDGITNYISERIRIGQKNGDVLDCNPDIVAFILLRTYTSLVTDWELRRQPLTDEEITQTFHQVFAVGLHAGGAQRA